MAYIWTSLDYSIAEKMEEEENGKLQVYGYSSESCQILEIS